MAVKLTLSSNRLDESDLQRLTQELVSTINKNTDVRAALPDSRPGAGERGDPITLGVITLAFIKSGAAAALFGVFAAYFARNKTLKVTLERDDGRKLTIDAANMSDDKVDGAMALARDFFDDKPAASETSKSQ